MRVLIIDDSRTMRRVQREVLSQIAGVEVLEAEDGVSAFFTLRDVQFAVDLILVDWMMPRMDGISFVELIKIHPYLRKIPVLMVTSISDERKMRRALEAGVDGYLLKPFTRELFAQALAALFPCTETAAQISGAPDGSPVEGRGFLDKLPKPIRRRVLDMSVMVEIPAGERIVASQSSADYFYFVIQGEVVEELGAKGASKDSTSSSVYGVGECFGVTELMSGDVLRHSFRARTGCTIGRLPKPAFEGMLLKYPEIGITLSKVLAAKARELDVEGGATDDLTGTFDILDLPDLVQAVSLRQRTCVLEFPSIDAEIGFHCGQIVFVRRGEQEGSEALFSIFGSRLPNFRLVGRTIDEPRNIFESTTSLLLECARRLDESAQPA